MRWVWGAVCAGMLLAAVIGLLQPVARYDRSELERSAGLA